jgi:pyruvate dehydrogenase E2 component (dihydrolipoamide acetyltransferase)
MTDFAMPILGADMTEGTVVTWRKQPGEPVERGEIIVEVETDKATVEVESFVAGTVEAILVDEGRKVPVGTSLAVIRVKGEQPVTAPPTPVVPPPPSVAVPAPVPIRAHGPGTRLRASPAAKQLAQELRVELSTVAGTGPEGRITREDVEQAARVMARPPDEAPDRPTRMRQAIAAAMSRSAREIPHFHLARDIDMGVAMQWLTEENEKKPIAGRLLYVVLLIKATALALREVPELNGRWNEGRVVENPAVNVGVAISLRGGGLVAPALLDADHRTLEDLMTGFRDLVQRARAGSLRGREITEPTITVTNLGEAGADSVFGLIYPPQVALVGFGRIVEKARAHEGEIAARPAITASLSADHRVVDGHRGSLFLGAIDRLLQEPERL